MDYRGALQQLADALTAGGVPAAVDPRDVTLPGALVEQLWIAEDILGDCSTVRVRVQLVAPDVGRWDALGHLDAMYALARVVLPPNTGTPTADRVTLLPDSSTGYPARALEIDIQVTPDPTP